MTEFNMILDAVLVILVLFVGFEGWVVVKKKYLRWKIEKNLIALYSAIQHFDRSQIASLRQSLRNSEGLISQDIIDKTRVLLALREGLLDVKEKKSSN